MIIYKNQEQALQIEVVKTINQEIKDLLWSMKWGTNGPIYQKIKNAEKDDNIYQPHFLLLRKADELIGMCTVSQRPMRFGDQEITSCYLQHFSVKKAYQGNKYSQILIGEARKYFEANIPKPFIGYAYIEGSNIRSQKAAKFIGYDPVQGFQTIFFSRMFPKKHSNVRRITPDEQPAILEKLHDFYKDYGFVHFTNTFHQDGYFVLEEDGKIIAGVQAYPVEWKIINMPGFMGKLIMNLVPHIPFINRLFNPKSHRFLVLDALFCEEGKEHQLFKLLESTLTEYKVYSSLLWLEKADPLFIKMDRLNQWGLLDKVEGKLPVTTIAKIHGLPEDKIEEWKKMPIYIAGFDSV